MMVEEEQAQHHPRGHEVGPEDRPGLESVEKPRAEDLEGSQRGHLEAAEEHEHAEEDVAVAIREGEEAGRHQAEGHEHGGVEDSVLDHQAGRDHERGGVTQPVEEGGAEESAEPHETTPEEDST